MTWLRRASFFILVNVMVMITVSAVAALVNIFLFGEAYPPQNSLVPLMVWSVLWGSGGAMISLFMSKFLAKRMYGLKMIDPKTASGMDRELVDTVHRLARLAHLPQMPEVGIYDSPEMNAFATGPSRSNSLVAVSTGLLRSMDTKQVEGVLAHEVAHVANGDMVTMALLQGIINSFVLFFARILAGIVASSMSSNNDNNRGGSPFLEFMLFQVFQIVFGILGSLAVCYYSRAREYRADKGGARYAGKTQMISALQALQRQSGLQLAHGQEPEQDKDPFANFKISNRKSNSWLALFSSHPPLEMRISRLQRGV